MSELAMVIDYKYCSGCYSCEVSCHNEKELADEEYGIKVVEQRPVKLDGKWQWNFLPIPSHLCDKCVDRFDRGETAPCELHCLSKCLEIIPLEKVNARLAELGDTAVCFV